MAKEKVSKEEFYNEIKRLYETYGKSDKDTFNNYSNFKINFEYYCKKYGGIKNILNELGYEFLYYNEIKKDEDFRNELINKGKDILKKYGKIRKTLCNQNGISNNIIQKVFGNFQKFYEAIGYDRDFHRNVSKKELLADIKYIINKTHNTTVDNYNRYGKFSKEVIRRFGGWPNLLIEIGEKPNSYYGSFENMVSDVKKLAEEYGFITSKLVDNNCSFRYTSFRLHFNSTEEMCKTIGYDLEILKYGRSSKERVIERILNEIIGRDSYHTEYTWDWLLNKNKPMYVDFYLPKINTVIEYDGEQHFKMVSRFHKSENDFIKQQERDKLKNKLILEHDINLIRIPYTQKITKKYINDIINMFI